MNRKSILICIAVLLVLVVGVAVAVFFLYSGTGSRTSRHGVSAGDPEYGIFQAVPSDALAVLHFDRLETLAESVSGRMSLSRLVPEGRFSAFLDSLSVRSASLGGLRSSGAVLSFHYVGGIEPLLVVDACRAGADMTEEIAVIEKIAEEAGLYCAVTDCSDGAQPDSYLAKRKIVSVSSTDVLPGSSLRHISRGVSVLDKDGFHEALASVRGGIGEAVISNSGSGRILEHFFTLDYRRYSDFLRRVSEWTAFSFDVISPERIVLSGSCVSGDGPDRFMNVFRSSSGAASEVFSVLPSYTVSAFSVPVGNVDEYIAAYAAYADTRIGRIKYDAGHEELRKRAGISPSEWARRLDIKEVSRASFYVGNSLESVLLFRPGRSGMAVFNTGTSAGDGGNNAAAGDFIYSGFASSLFGSLFSLPDESRFICMEGWVIVGSDAALQEYSSGRALDNTLASYMESAGMSADYRAQTQHFLGYYSMTADSRSLEEIFRPAYAGRLSVSFGDVSYAPVLFSITSSKGKDKVSLTVGCIEEVISKAPSFERDTVITVPKGPFKVRNSGTGKINSFYQQDNMYLCLNDENGKGMWAAEFSSPICGRASTIDYFANGRLQIIFASGSKLYLIDRLGRWVRPFPLELGKAIRLGPDVYDFNGRRTYNVMVLHTDNTIEMYNLKGKKPAAWKGITASETIKGLPEPVKVDGSTWWVVRTSIRTLIFPFYGGEPVQTGEGDRMIRPDSKVLPVSGGVRVTGYDGRTVTVELKKQ